jgi:translocator protein
MTALAATAPRPSAARSVVALVAFLLISYGVAALGSLATIQNVDGWYADADKVFWSPPNALFGPVWTVLYGVMSVAAWLVWRRRETTDVRRPLSLYVAQLVLNAIWTPVFFGLYPAIGVTALWIGAVIILALDVAVLLTMLSFWRVRRLAALLLIPYWAWVLFATTLNIGTAVLNP